MASGIGKQIAEHNGGAIYKQIQKVTSLELTSTWASVTFPLQAQKSSKTGWATPRPTAMTKDTLKEQT